MPNPVAAYTSRLRANSPAVPETQAQNVSCDPYGRLIVNVVTASEYGAADEGSYFVASNGVAGAPIADQTVNSPNTAVPSDVAPGLLIQNTNVVGGASIWLKRVFRFVVAPGTAAQTGVDVQCQLDAGLLYTSGGTLLTTKNANPRATTASGAQVYAGAIVKAAKTLNVLYVGRSKPRNTIAIASDEYIWRFGATSGPTSFITSTATATRTVTDHGAFVIPPQYTFSMHFAYGLTVTGSPTSDWEVGFIER